MTRARFVLSVVWRCFPEWTHTAISNEICVNKASANAKATILAMSSDIEDQMCCTARMW